MFFKKWKKPKLQSSFWNHSEAFMNILFVLMEMHMLQSQYTVQSLYEVQRWNVHLHHKSLHGTGKAIEIIIIIRNRNWYSLEHHR